MKDNTKSLVVGALIAALYAGLTFMSNFFGLGYGPVQFRVSEALTVLPVFTPAAIWGVTVGCFISNIMSFNPVDMVFGTVATLCAALLTYSLRNLRIKDFPLASVIMPVIINAAVVGAELVLFVSREGGFTAFLISALWIAASEAVTCIGLGGLLFTAVKKNRKLRELFS